MTEPRTPLEIAQQVLDSTLAEPQSASHPNLFRKAALILDAHVDRARSQSSRMVACKAGCSFCCWDTVLLDHAELLAVLEAVKELPKDLQERIKERARQYERTVAPIRHKPLTLARAQCPLLEDGLCLVYKNRPFACRSRNSFDVSYCAASKADPADAALIPRLTEQLGIYQAGRTGFEKALAGRMPPDRYELGQALALILPDPTKLEARPGIPRAKRADPPKTFSYPQPIVVVPPAEEALKLLDQGKLAEADRFLDDRNVLHLFAKLRMPAMNESSEQIEESCARFLDTLGKIEDLAFDPREGMAGLVAHQSYGLAYQGLSVKALLARQGEVFKRIAARAVGDLREPLPEKRQPGKPRVGYLSHNMRYSNGCRWSLGWLANHGPEFETYAFNLSAHEDSIGQQFKAAADRYFHIKGGYEEVAKFIRSHDLDVLIFTDLGLAAGDYAYATLRLARVQCTAWGHPVTSGLDTIGFYLSSEMMEPELGDDEYTEKLVRLPNSGLVMKRPAYDVPTLSRAELGLEEGFLPLMCQAILKWCPSRDSILARLYERLEAPLTFVGSLYAPGDELFAKRIAKLGVKARILPRTHSQQFNRYIQTADVVYDPPDWSGGNTTLEAIWAGTPVATWPGPFMRGRHSLAFNQIAGAQGMIANSEDDFVDLVFDPDRHRAAMANCDREVLFEDKVASNALNAFLSSVVRV